VEAGGDGDRQQLVPSRMEFDLVASAAIAIIGVKHGRISIGLRAPRQDFR
jgi:hypothetical protein